MIGRALATWAVLIAVAGPAGWALAGLAARVARRAEQRAGKGSASQAPGSPAPRHWPPLPGGQQGRCGGYGPSGMRCDRDPHADGRCEQGGIGWYCTTGQVAPGWRWAGGRRG